MRKLLFISLLFFACDKVVDPPPKPSMTGTWAWKYQIDTGETRTGMIIVVTQNGESLSGSGTYFNSSCTVSGFNKHPEIGLTITIGTFTRTASGHFVNNNHIVFTFIDELKENDLIRQ